MDIGQIRVTANATGKPRIPLCYLNQL